MIRNIGFNSLGDAVCSFSICVCAFLVFDTLSVCVVSGALVFLFVRNWNDLCQFAAVVAQSACSF